MRFIGFVAILSMMSSVAAQDVGDFSPTDVGREWVYNYRYHASGVTAGWREDTTIIRMSVLAKETVGDTDIVYVGVVDSGFTYIRFQDGGSSAVIDSTAEFYASYVDTFDEVDGMMAKRGDALVWPPFCPRSTVPADSCRYQGWTAQYLYTVTGAGSTTQFLTDAGLSHHESTEDGADTYITYYHLMSYDVPAGMRLDTSPECVRRTPAGHADAIYTILGNRTERGSFDQYGLELRVIDGSIHKRLRLNY